MIKGIYLAEEIVISTRNKVGILADVSMITANNGINIDAVLGYEAGLTAKLLLITSANLLITNELKKLRYKIIKETEVLVVDLTNKPGALKVVAMELKTSGIDIQYVYVTSCSCGGSSRMVLQTSDNERAMSLLGRYAETKKET